VVAGPLKRIEQGQLVRHSATGLEGRVERVRSDGQAGLIRFTSGTIFHAWASELEDARHPAETLNELFELALREARHPRGGKA
jgi:hypothetical protein